MKRSIIILMLMAIFGCTTTKTVVDRVEVPVPYWTKPDNIKELPARKPLESKRITPEEAQVDTQQAFRAVGEDIRSLIEENEYIRHLYNELVKLISTPPEGDPQ